MTRKWQPKLKVMCGSCGWKGKRTKRMFTKKCPKDAQQTFKAALRGGDIAARALANNRFHEITGDMAGNTYLQPSFQRLLIDHARISMTFFRPSDAEMAENLCKASDQHDQIIVAIEHGDAVCAGDLATQHWNLSRHRIKQFVLPTGLDLALGTA